MTYAEKLRDPRWRMKRLEIITLAGDRCEDCGNGKTDSEAVVDYFEVHHVAYVRGREPWDYPSDLLMCLCPTCHTDRQVEDEEAQFEFARMCRRMSRHHVRALAKRLRASLDGGWSPQQHDAYQAMRDSA